MLVGPALVADAGAGEVDDGVEFGAGRRVDRAGGRVPPSSTSARLTPPIAADDGHHLVTAFAEMTGQGGADQAGRPSDADAHGVDPTAIELRALTVRQVGRGSDGCSPSRRSRPVPMDCPWSASG